MRAIIVSSFVGALLFANPSGAQEDSDKSSVSVGGSLKGDTGSKKEAETTSEASAQAPAGSSPFPSAEKPTPAAESEAAPTPKETAPATPQGASDAEELEAEAPTEDSSTSTHWFWPRREGRHLYIEQPKTKVERSEWALGLVYDIHPFILGPVDGWAHEVRAVFGRDWVGLSAGLYSPDGRLSLGLDFGRHLGFEMNCEESPYQYSFLTPTFEPRVLLDFKRGDPIVALGVAWAGLRIARHPLALDMRFPRTDLFIDPESGRTALSMGLSLGGSYGF